VIGRLDEVRGEEVHAVVVLTAGGDLAELEAHCRARLAPFKVLPAGRSLRAPKTSTGKIDKKPLRAAMADAHRPEQGEPRGNPGRQGVLITGAASGIGRATALEAQAEGASLLLSDIDDDQARPGARDREPRWNGVLTSAAT